MHSEISAGVLVGEGEQQGLQELPARREPFRAPCSLRRGRRTGTGALGGAAGSAGPTG
jgi:hypothetical protein